jgi:soluble cytochrome b562
MPTNVDKFFAYEHLPESLQEVSKPVAELQKFMEDALPDSAEKSAGMRKLLEAKDCFVRARLERQ